MYMEKELDPNRPDLNFTCWILVWFVLYFFKVIHYNPKYLLILGIVLAVLQFGVLVLYYKSISYIIAFIMANLLLKGLPLYVIYSAKTTAEDVYVLFIFVVLYAVYLKLNNKNIYRFFVEFMTPSVNGRKSFPVINPLQALLSKL